MTNNWSSAAPSRRPESKTTVLKIIRQPSLWDSLIGICESQTVEFKRELPDLGNSIDLRDILKQICGMANAKGGLIVFGIETTDDPVSNVDYAIQIIPIKLANQSFGRRLRYKALRHLHPPISIDTHCHQSPQGDALISVAVSRVKADLCVVIDVSNSGQSHLFSSYVRDQQGIRPLSIAEIKDKIKHNPQMK